MIGAFPTWAWRPYGDSSARKVLFEDSNGRNSMIAQEVVTMEDSQLIQSLRLLIARAANRDSLDWWSDESLAGHSVYLFDRLFPIAPRLAARSLALRAAQSRHRAALGVNSSVLHLFRLDSDNQDGLATRDIALEPLPMPHEPIPTMDALRDALLHIVGSPQQIGPTRQTADQGLLIELSTPPAGVSSLRHRAQTLAWAYLEGAPGLAVFPFFME